MKTLICVVQLGSSQMSAAAAWRDSDGTITVVAIESEATKGTVNHGVVVSVDETASHVKTLMMKLNNRLLAQGIDKVENVYVGVGGMSLHSLLHHPSTTVDVDRPITDDIIVQLRRQGLQTNLSGYSVLDIVTTGYSLDGEWTANPIDAYCHELTAHNQLIIAQQELEPRVMGAIERAGYRVLGTIIAPLATARILTDEERQRGCVLLDIGATTTTVSIYAGGVLHRLVTLPLGGDVVTRDIATRGLRIDEAEQLKTQWSNASGESPEESTSSDAAAQMPAGITAGELNSIVVCRYEELLANVAYQIEQSGQDGQLKSGCILTGGTAMQKGLTTLVRRRLGIDRITARSFTAYGYNQSERKPRLTSLLAMLGDCQGEARHAAQAAPSTHDTDEAAGTTPTDAPTPVATTVPATPVGTHTTPRKVRERNHGGGLGGFFKDLFSAIDDEPSLPLQ